MSDQADNLRQLVRARRAWGELALEELPPPVTVPRSGGSPLLADGASAAAHPRAGTKRACLLVSLAARWALDRIGR